MKRLKDRLSAFVQGCWCYRIADIRGGVVDPTSPDHQQTTLVRHNERSLCHMREVEVMTSTCVARTVYTILTSPALVWFRLPSHFSSESSPPQREPDTAVSGQCMRCTESYAQPPFRRSPFSISNPSFLFT